MPRIQYAFREDVKTIAMLTQGSTAACPLCQIVTLRKREITPEFLDHLMVMDVKGTNFPASALTEYGRNLTQQAHPRKFLAVVDSQIEFTVKSRTMHKLTEFLPAYTGTALYNFFEGQPNGFLVVLKVYSISEEVPNVLMTKGRMGSAQIISLYDQYGEKTYYNILSSPQPIIDEGTFDNIKYEILHALRVENALIGVYGNDVESKRLLRQKRDDYNESTGIYKHTFNEEDDVDRAQVDYEITFSKVLEYDPGLLGFVNYVRNIKPPQLVEWQTLLPNAVNGDLLARHRLVEMYMRNVLRMAVYFVEKYKLPIADVIQDGLVGLMTAIDKFEESNTDLFQQYYPLWVRQVIQREMSTYMYTRYFSTHSHEKMLTIKELGLHKGLILPDDYHYIDNEFYELVRDKLSINMDATIRYLQNFCPDISIESYFEDSMQEDEYSDESLLYDGTYDILQCFQIEEIHKVLTNAMQILNPREKRIVQLRFGLDDGCFHTLEETGKRLNITRERTRQLEARALRKLRINCDINSLHGYLD